MVIGFILIKTAPTRELEILRALVAMKEVVDSHILFGEYDLIVKLDMEDIEAMGNILVGTIRKIEGIRDTKTLPGISF